MMRKVASMLDGLHVGERSKVALMLPNVPQFSAAYYGSLFHGNTVVPFNVLFKRDEVQYLLDDSGAEALFVWEGFLTEAQAAFANADGCKHLVIIPQDPKSTTEFEGEGVHNFNSLVGKAGLKEGIASTSADDTAVILYTSGTTGHPKGAELSHFNLFQNAQYSATKLLPMNNDDVLLATLPLFHSFAQTVVQNAGFFAGGTVVLLPRFDATAALTLMQEHGVTIFAGVPTMYFALLNHPKAEEFNISSLRFCVSGGSAMPVEVMSAFDKKYNVNILEGYGLSETSPVASFNSLSKPKKAGSIGIPIDYVEFRLVDEKGGVITEPDTKGEIQIKGVNVMKGYFNRKDRGVTADGWFASGDVATRDADGYYFIVDRKKDIVVRGGYNVYPRQIEEVLYQHEAIREAAVIGIPDEKFGEEVKAVIALKAGKEATEEEIVEFCKSKLFAYPRVVEIIESLPKTATGKILKRELRPKKDIDASQ